MKREIKNANRKNISNHTHATHTLKKAAKAALLVSTGFLIGICATHVKTESASEKIPVTSINVNSVTSYTTGNGTLTLNTADGNAYKIHADNTVRTFTTEECIPLSDVAFAFKSTTNYWCFELKDTTNMLEDKTLPAYDHVARKINSCYDSVTWNNNGITLINKGDTFSFPR